MSVNGTPTERPPDTAEPLAPYDIGPFNDAMAFVIGEARKTRVENRFFRFILVPAFALCLFLALTNSTKPDHVYVKTIVVTCYVNQDSSRLRLHQRIPNEPTQCDHTSTDVSDLLPIQKDANAQDAIVRAQLPVILRECFSITTSTDTVSNIHDLCNPYLDEHSQAYAWFADYFKKNNVAKLAVTQTNSVIVDPIQAPTQLGQYVVGYTVTASNGTEKAATHYLATVAIHFVQPSTKNTAGMKLYQYTVDDSKAGEPDATVTHE
jgi:hypothetical protein